MKKAFLFFTAVIMVLAIASCGDSKNDDPEYKTSFNVPNLNVNVVAGGQVFHKSTTTVSFELIYTSALANLTFQNISFAPQMPAITFSLEGLKLTGIDDNRVRITSNQALTPIEGYTVTGFVADADFKNSMMEFTVSRGESSYHVVVFSPIQFTYPITATGSEYTIAEVNSALAGKSFSSLTDTYFAFDLPRYDNKLPYLHMFNISFTEAMPKQAHLRIPLANATITDLADGYQIEASEIIPEYPSGSTWVPMETRPVTNLKATVHFNSQYTIEFDCFGQHYSRQGHIYGTIGLN